MKYLLPLLLLASCEPLSIIHDDITGSGPDWGEGSSNPNLSDLCTVHDSSLDSLGFLGDFPTNDAYHLCGEVSAEDWITVQYVPAPFTLELEAATYGYTTAEITVVEWPEDLPNALKDFSYTIIDQFILEGQETRSYNIVPTQDSAYMSIIIKAIQTSNFNDYYVRIDHGL